MDTEAERDRTEHDVLTLKGGETMRYYYRLEYEPTHDRFLNERDVENIPLEEETPEIVSGFNDTKPSDYWPVFYPDDSNWMPGDFATEAEAREALLYNLNQEISRTLNEF